MSDRVLDINDLAIRFTTQDGDVEAVRGVSCHVNAGECLGIVGESGSGKSQSFLAAMGLLARNGSATGRIAFDGTDLLQLDGNEINRIRGKRLSMIFQDPLTSLTPHLRIGLQMQEVLSTHLQLTGSAAEQRCLQWLDRVHIPEAGKRLRQYPHELSGGMRQRVMIAMCMLCNPECLIADEPTTALDVTIQAEILDLMEELKQEQGTAIVMITHDMGVVARMCDRIQVMREGEFVEQGTVDDIFYNPQHAYTKMLLDAVPRIAVDTDTLTKSPGMRDDAEPLLAVDDIRVQFRIPRGWFQRPAVLPAVDGITFTLQPGETLGVVGESGSGKSTLARAILKLVPTAAGHVSWLGRSLATLDQRQLRHARRDLQIVFQDPMASLNPSLTVGQSIMEPLSVHETHLSPDGRKLRVAEMMKRVGLQAALINRYPHELSGGQNQRVGIARAMILNPKLVICDEAVSALDVSVQAQVIGLLEQLQQEFGVSFIFISHDLSVVSEISHRVLVMYLGSVVELAGRDQLFRSPQHPYTQQLISAVPVPDPAVERQRQRIRLQGERLSPLSPAARLRFLPSRVKNYPDYQPGLYEFEPGHWVAEHDPVETLVQQPVTSFGGEQD
ncbi:MAG: ABC transporter ATP-binding protein [Gammaproteobacteria bacterium]|nr:ABC transporter ATP-binding protein [Gammaproteobacteria bacterium]